MAVLGTADRTVQLHAREAMDEVRRCGGIAVDITDSDDSIELGPDGRFDAVPIACGSLLEFDVAARPEGAPVVVDPAPDAKPLSRRLARAAAGDEGLAGSTSARRGVAGG